VVSQGKECEGRGGACAKGDDVVKRNGLRVTLRTSLSYDDRRILEYVSGHVYSFTGAASSRAERMRVGGALLRADKCSEVFTEGTIMDSGDTVVEKRHYAY